MHLVAIKWNSYRPGTQYFHWKKKKKPTFCVIIKLQLDVILLSLCKLYSNTFIFIVPPFSNVLE